MRLELSCSALLAIASVSTDVDAFVSPLVLRRSAFSSSNGNGWEHDNIFDALKSSSSGDGAIEDDEEEVSQGGSRFKEMLAASQNQDRVFKPIDNPFLNPNPTAAPGSASLDNLSVEDQARMFREMMQQSASGDPAAQQSPAPTRPNPRPVGRNRDADSIANTSDLYFAQLKRDSTVRGIARIQGDSEKAEAVMEDDGIRQLEDLLHSNPYLKGLKDKEQEVIEAVPEEVLMPYFESDNTSESMKSYSGISYKDKLKQRRNKKSGGGESGAPSSSTTASPVAVTPTVEESLSTTPPPTPQVQVETIAEEPKQQVTIPAPPTPAAEDKVKPAESPEKHATASPATVEQPPASSIGGSDTSSSTMTATSDASTEEVRQKIRNLMGMTLKHRGGLGFGKGRLKGPEIDRFESMLDEVTALLKEEAMQQQGASSPPPPPPEMMSEEPAAPASTVKAESVPAATSSSTASTIAVEPASHSDAAQVHSSTIAVATASPSDAAQVDSVIACIEGAVMMYKNSPPELKEGVLFSLRGALSSALNTCDKVIGRNVVSHSPSQPEAVTVTVTEPSSTTAEVEASPPLKVKEVQEAPAPEPVAVVQEPAPAPPVVVPATSDSSNIGADANSKVLEEIYSEIKSASGDGRLGLKSDLSQDDASRVASKIEEMRSLLMEELETGIPAAKSSTAPATAEASPSSSAGSKYQQMLAKARASKASS